MVARTTAYGVTKVDTATFTVTLPIFQIVTAFQPSEVQIAPHGYVFWTNVMLDSEEPVATEVTFDDSSNVAAPPSVICDVIVGFFGPGASCGSGDFLLPAIRNFPGAQVRQFPVPGVYPYHTGTGATGRVIVEAGASASMADAP
jgi:hypothetical protein